MKLQLKPDPFARVTIPCPQCSQKQEVLLSKLRTNPQLTCSNGHSFKIAAGQLDRVLKALAGPHR